MAQEIPLKIDQGSHFTRKFRFYTDAENSSSLDLTGATAAMQFRLDNFDGRLIAALTLTDASGLTIDVESSSITVDISAEASSSVRSRKGEDEIVGRYDLEVVLAGEKRRLMQGDFTISREVTVV